MQKLKVLELFAGIGACSKALERLNIPHEIMDAVEIDKYAIQSFNAIHGTNFEPQDITTWDKDINVDLICHGSPCTNFSLAGKQEGGNKGSGTPSSLMYETIRIVEKLKPKYVVWENVKNLLSNKHRHNFDAYLQTMEQLGYNNYYQVLNAKDYLIPQNRERVFTVSIRNDLDKDFHFPEKQPLKLRLKDLLDKEVDKKYYLSDTQVNRIKTSTYISSNRRIQEKDWCDTLCTGDWEDPKCIQVASLPYFSYESDGRVYSPSGINPTLRAKEPNNKIDVNDTILIKNKSLRETLEQNDIEKDISYIDAYNRNIRKDDLSGTITTRVSDSNNTFIAIKKDKPICLNSKGGRNGVEGLQPSRKDRVYSSDGIAVTIATSDFYNPNYTSGLQIRKLTPKECWRLMGFDDEDFEKASRVNSNTQLYKQAGNSIVVTVLEAIFKELFSEYIPNLDKWSDLD